jgi:hypothetical protein
MATPFPFGSGNTLLASQLNAITTLPVSTKTASYVLTVADLGTRVVMNSASATTITVNTSIFAASDVVEIANIGAGVCTITAGTCTVGTTGSLALAQNATGKLIFISASAAIYFAGAASSGAVTLIETLSPSNVATTQFTTSSFSSTYKFYTIKYSFNNTFTFNLRSAGSTITAANYKRWRTGTVSTSAAFNSVAGGETSVPLVNSSTVVYPVNGTINTQSDCTVSGYQVFDCHQVINQQSGATNAVVLYQALYEANQAYDSLLFTGVTGNLTGTVKLYGWS